MASQQLDEEAIFHVARQIPAPEARSTYLDQVCSGDLGLRGRVEELLRVHERESEFLKSSADPGYWWAERYLEIMEAEPSWPSWIEPITEEQPQFNDSHGHEGGRNDQPTTR